MYIYEYCENFQMMLTHTANFMNSKINITEK